MKCDKLKAEQWLDYSGEPMPCYPKAKVDAAIAELKQKLVDSGISVRQAYRMVAHAKAENKVKQEFDYDRETPKGEWV